MITRIQRETGESVRRICEVLQVPRSSYFHAAKPTATQLDDAKLGDLIEAIFREHRGRYGYRRIHREVRADHGVNCAECRVRRLMCERGLKALNKRRFVPRTSDGKANAPAPNLVKEVGLPKKPGEVFAGDITYLPCAGGWLFLAVVLDLCTRRVVGWAVSDSMHAELVCKALENALETARVNDSAIFHSDRGSQYSSAKFRTLLEENAMQQSMSAIANPYDNAWTESFMSTLKTEMLGDGIFEDIDDARATLFEYIEAYYNTKRKHSAIGYKTPMQVENLILTIPLK